MAASRACQGADRAKAVTVLGDLDICREALGGQPGSGVFNGWWPGGGGAQRRLLIALAQSTAGQVTQGLLNDSSVREVQLLQEYLRACQHTGGIVIALTSDLVLMNDFARDVLDPGDQAPLLGHAAEALAGDLRGPVDVGKLALLRAVHQRHNPAGAFYVLDDAEAGDHNWMVLGELLESEGGLVIRHVDRLRALRLQALWIALEQALAVGRQQALWVPRHTVSVTTTGGEEPIALPVFPPVLPQKPPWPS